jgi:hypothetical protein
MLRKVNKFSVTSKNVNGLIEPNFNEKIPFSCNFKDGLFEVAVVDLTDDVIANLKTKYKFVSSEEVEIPDLMNLGK